VRPERNGEAGAGERNPLDAGRAAGDDARRAGALRAESEVEAPPPPPKTAAAPAEAPNPLKLASAKEALKVAERKTKLTPEVDVQESRPASNEIPLGDAHEMQRIRGSIAEGEMLLRGGKKNDGARYTEAELGAIRRAVANSKAKLGEHLDAAIQRVQKQLGDERGSFSRKPAPKGQPTLLDDLVTVGQHYLETAGAKFADWRKAMVEAFGDRVKPELLKVWQRVKLQGNSERGSFSQKPTSKDLREASQESLVSPEAEAESKATDKSNAEKLLGQQLTAQMRSGMAAKPTKLKPAQNRSLFDVDGPEQGGLFGSERGSFSRKKLPAQSEGPDFTKKRSLAKEAADFFKPAGTRIAQEGPLGQELNRKLARAQDIGEVTAGKRVVKLKDAGLDDLSRTDRQNLVDSLQGFASPKNDAVQKAYDGIRGVTDEIARDAAKAGVKVKEKRTLRPGDPTPEGVTLTKRQDEKAAAGERIAITYQRPFRGRENFYPHVIPSGDALQKGAIRQDVLDNMVRNGIRPDVKEAASMLDEYRKFMDEGGRAKQLEKHLVDTGQARDAAEAYMMLNRFRKRAIKRQGSLEYSRTADLPFYDPDPARVLPKFVTATSLRLAQVREFGQNNERINAIIRTIDATGGNAEFVRSAVDRAIGIVNEPDSAGARISQAARMIQGFKLGLSFVPNATQGALNSLLKGDLPSTLAGGKALFTKEGRRFAMQSGASLEGVINEMLRNVGTENSALGTFLKATGFTHTEQANRVWAANAGLTYARRMLAQLQKDPKNGRARDVLVELGLKPDVLLKLGKIDGDAALIAAKKFSDMTQFRGGVLDLPLFAASSMGKVAFQFKSFIYGQTRLLHDELVGEFAARRFGRAFRNLLILATVFPVSGELIDDVRSFITGKKRTTSGIKRYFEDIAQSGALGVIDSLLSSGSYGKATEWIAGPTASDAGELVDAGMGPNKMRALGRFVFRRIPLMGPVLYNRVFPPREKASSPETRKLIGKPKR
jgi:hypothetical protein